MSLPGQMSLLDWVAAQPQNFRASDPDTSRSAGEGANRFRGADQEQIFQALQRAGRPLAAEEISDRLRWDNHVRVNRRLAELAAPVIDEFGALVRPALIERTEQKHTNRSGRQAYRYQVRQSVRGVTS